MVDENHQFWDQTLRQTIRSNDCVALRESTTFNLSCFQRTKAIIDSGEASTEDVTMVGDLLACFVFKLNERFAHNWDYTEAMSVFDPRPTVRQKNKGMVREYLIILLKRFRLPTARAKEFDSFTIINHAQNFYALVSDEAGYDFDEDSQPIGRYYRHFYEGRADIRAFSFYAVHCLRLYLVTVACEARFNIMKLRQNKGNMSLRPYFATLRNMEQNIAEESEAIILQEPQNLKARIFSSVILPSGGFLPGHQNIVTIFKDS